MNLPNPSSAKRNFAFNAASNAINILYPLATFAYVSHIMGPEMVGRINLATSLASWFALVAAAAIPLYGSRQVARVRDDPDKLGRVFSELVIVNLGATLFACALFLGCFLFPGRVQEDWRLFAAAGLFIVANCVSLEWLFQGLEDFPSTFFRMLCVKIGSFLVLVILVRDQGDYVMVAAIAAASTAMYNLWNLKEARKRARFRLTGIRPADHLKPLAVLSMAAIASSAYLYLDGVLLGFMAGDHALGLYSTANRITRTAHVVVMALTVAVIPRISRILETGNREEYRALSRKSLHTVWFLCFPIAAMLWALSPKVIAVLAGPDFADAAFTLRLNLALLPLAGFNSWLGLQVLFPNGLEKPLLFSSLAAAATNLALNLILIPRFAENGCAVAAVGAEACVLIILVAFAKGRYLEFRLVDGRAIRYLGMAVAAGAVTYGISICLPGSVAAAAASLAVGSFFYLVALRALKDPAALDIIAAVAAKLRTASGRSA